jgi:hypothetical protein
LHLLVNPGVTDNVGVFACVRTVATVLLWNSANPAAISRHWNVGLINILQSKTCCNHRNALRLASLDLSVATAFSVDVQVGLKLSSLQVLFVNHCAHAVKKTTV